jgi:hypothetical protein
MPRQGPKPSESRLRSPELSVVVPTFNEAANVEILVDALVAALGGIDWEVIVVDDDSLDGTADAVRLIARQDGRVRCIRRIGRRGLAGASIEGMLSSSAPVIAIMDGDLQHDESLLPEMLARIRAGDALVIASRFCDAGSAADGLSRTRLSGSRAATWLARNFLHIDVSDPMSGCFAMRRDAFEALAPRLCADRIARASLSAGVCPIGTLDDARLAATSSKVAVRQKPSIRATPARTRSVDGVGEVMLVMTASYVCCGRGVHPDRFSSCHLALRAVTGPDDVDRMGVP